MTTPYVTGTVSVTAGSAIVTGSGTAWETSELVPGIFGSSGIAVPVESIDSDTQITLALEWPGATASGQEYWITYDTTPGQQTVANAQRLAEYIARLNNPALAAAAGVTPSANKVLLFTGANTATLIDLEDLIQGVKFDAEVPNLAGRAAYDGQPKDFRVLVADVGDGRSAFYTKLSSASADWSVPFYISGVAGPAGVANPRGTYAAGTAYAKNDLVLDNGSSWIAKIATTGNAPPTLPTTSNTWWQLAAQAGANGTGTGDVVGPSVSVNNRVAVFNGTTGKLLKDSGVVLGDAAAKNTGTTSGTVAAGDDPRFSAGGQNEGILSLEIADLKGSRLGMKGGVADAFDDEAGVSVNVLSRIADATPTTPLGGTPANINDNNNATTSSAAIGDLSGVSSINSRIFARLDFGSVKSISRIECRGLVASAGGSATLAAMYYSTDGTSWTKAGGDTAFTTTPSNHVRDVAVTARYVAIIFAQSGFGVTMTVADLNAYIVSTTGDSTNQVYDAANDWYTPSGGPTYNTMTLRSINYAAASQPATARLAVQLVEADAITINTDVIGRVSRDGGTTWATAALSLSQSLIGPKIYEASGINLASLGAGTSMRWEIATANGKYVAVSGVVLQWS